MRKTRIYLHQSERGGGDFPLGYGTKLVDFAAWLNGLVEQIPSPWRANATIEVGTAGGYEGDYYATLSIEYTRPETSEEQAARETDEWERANDFRDRELHLLAELQAKYGIKP